MNTTKHTKIRVEYDDLNEKRKKEVRENFQAAFGNPSLVTFYAALKSKPKDIKGKYLVFFSSEFEVEEKDLLEDPVLNEVSKRPKAKPSFANVDLAKA